MTKLETIASDVCARQSVELYDLEFVGTGQGRTLQIFISKPDGKIGIEDCSNVSKGLNEILDADEALIPGGPYSLEVSSPGLERPLRRPSHFEGAVGETAWVKLTRSLGEIAPEFPVTTLRNAKQLTGKLLATNTEGVELDVEGTPTRIVWSDIDKGKTVFDFDALDTKSEGAKANPKNKKNKDHKKKVGH
ncbi:MAG: ribosome maturation factor RimP [Bdellovibrionaceae bacterium]|nr:ribosome maturation factor RimP [Pseudobdellovibrionaceae bacterium]